MAASLSVNDIQVYFTSVIAMEHTGMLSVLLERLVKLDFGESVKLHPLKVLNNRSVHTYTKNNLGVGPAGETSKVSGVTMSEQQSTVYSIQSLTNKPQKEADETTKLEKATIEKKNKRKEKVVPVMVVYTAQGQENKSADKEASTHAGPQQIIVPQPQANIDTTKELTSLKDIIYSIGSNVDRIKDDTFIAKHTTLQFNRQLETKIDGLKTSLVAEMVECIKDIRDAQKGEGKGSKNRRLL
ncbi:hypothetical protein F511_09786 [Dorcoceras hygrometricum]|uniref:Uncharacterized protein n=1 Tax=Dorcoceras hygrometricum TaxID=472368 RepID=A0A2Z7AD34_9LAMI|nr:hypothetical protein F511_09786 [Dorcoceras hygrometricum]